MDRTNIKERGMSILVSLLFHAAILFLLIEIVPPVRVYLYRQVAEVRIISPERMYIPRIAGLSEETRISGELSKTETEEMPSVPGIEDRQQMESPEPGVVYLRNLAIGRDTEKSDFSRTKPSFDLVPSPLSEGGFSLGIDRKKPETAEMDLSEYDSPALSQMRFNRIMTHKGENPPSQLAHEVLNQQEGYDIALWVKGVVDKIRNNWTLPPIDESIAIGDVKIHVIFGKQGELVSLKIVESSDFVAFERAAMGAIRSSVPFPPMPDDFPSGRLEAYLVFQFNE